MIPLLDACAVIVARGGELPPDAAEALAEAGGYAVVAGDGASRAVTAVTTQSGPAHLWWYDTRPGLRPGLLASRLAPVLDGIPLLILPGSADGRDLAPRLAAMLGRPLLTGAALATLAGTGVRADLCRLDATVTVPAEVDGPAVVTLEPGTVPAARPGGSVTRTPLGLPPDGAEPDGAGPADGAEPPDAEVLAVLDPAPAALDLAEARTVLSGGAGLAAGASQQVAQASFALLADVAAALGAAWGATRVATDAGWASADRQIGTTGVAIAPEVYVAFGVSGATQHTSGLGEPRHIVSVNLDPHCPMTALSTRGIVCDARAALVALADRLGVSVPAEVRGDG